MGDDDSPDRARAKQRFWERYSVNVSKTARANVKALAAVVKTPFKSPVATHTRAAGESNKERLKNMDAFKKDSDQTRSGRSKWQFILGKKAREKKRDKPGQQPYYSESTFDWCMDARGKMRNIKDWSDIEDMMTEMFRKAGINAYVEQPDKSKLPNYESTEARQKYDYLRGSGATVTGPRPPHSAGAEIELSQLSADSGVMWSNEGDPANMNTANMEVNLPREVPFHPPTPIQGGILAERLSSPEVGDDGFSETQPKYDNFDPNNPKYDDLDVNNPKYLNNLDSAYLSVCLLYTSPSPRDLSTSRMPSSA